jgi:4-hydroxy 2-oxovalerate aldolase
MQSSGYPPDDYISLLEELGSWDNIDILYFADSLGNMDSTEVTRICNLFKEHWEGEIGFHAHNNRGFALNNSLVSIENGASWCDGTILGMGRGAGNTPMENLLLSLQSSGSFDFNSEALYELIEEHFLPLKNEYKWGPNFSYHYAALSKIHPTFVQRLLSEKRYDSKQVLSALKYLSGIDARSYNQDLLRTAVFPLDEDQQKGTWDATGWLEGREALIIGAGPSVKKHLKGITNYIKNNRLAVLVLNMKKEIPVDLVTVYVACHPSRIMIEVGSYKNLGAPLILPLTQFRKFLGQELAEVEVLDYGLGLVENGIQIGAKGCGVEQPLAIGYALAVATQAGAKEISLVGFDGYGADDPRQEEMNDLFQAYTSDSNSVPLTSLTPTSYNLNQGSIYSAAFE